MSKPPVVIPLGAMRFNSDMQKLEFFNGMEWLQVDTFNPNLDGGCRGFFADGYTGPSYSNEIIYITIPITSNGTDFGDLSAAKSEGGSGSSNTRG